MTSMMHLTCGNGMRLVGCAVTCLTMSCATTTAAARDDKTTTDATALVEVLAPPGLPGRMSKGYFDDNPGCVRAKLDIWLARGRHTHQVFPMIAEPDAVHLPSGSASGQPEALPPPIHTIMDADGTTIFVGGDGCRIRIRIDRAE